MAAVRVIGKMVSGVRFQVSGFKGFRFQVSGVRNGADQKD
jgi:hypothetical protein